MGGYYNSERIGGVANGTDETDTTTSSSFSSSSPSTRHLIIILIYEQLCTLILTSITTAGFTVKINIVGSKDSGTYG